MTSKKSALHTKSKTTLPILKKVRQIHSVTEYILPSNGLRILYAHRPHTGVVTSDIVYFVGSRDEKNGETGLAHMLEHMLFKPTTFDVKRKTDSASMLFERETGIRLNANTWKDRTSYYFSYPKEYFEHALQIEAERMQGTILSEKEFSPERTNVLSEYDMYAGDEHFALSVQMTATGFSRHPYHHETIGFREDIEEYTPEKLERFYRTFYAPNNAALIIAGDVSEKDMKEMVLKYFASLPISTTLPKREIIREPKQEGIRTTHIKRPTSTQILGIGMKHAPFPTKDWMKTMILFDLLAGGEDSILHKKFIDTGLASHISTSLEPTREQNMAILYITLTPKITHDALFTEILDSMKTLTIQTITPYLKKSIAKELTHEALTHENSLSFVSELVEYVSADAWELFFDSEKILKSITPKDIHAHLHALIAPTNMTVGYFEGTHTK